MIQGKVSAEFTSEGFINVTSIKVHARGLSGKIAGNKHLW